MRSVAGWFIAAVLASATFPAAADSGAFGLRSGIMPENEQVPSAALVLARPTKASTLTLATAVFEPDGWIDRSDDGATAFTARLRAGYQATPSVQPFVEMELLQRQYGAASGGQSAASYAWRAGMSFDHVVSGEFALGYVGALSGNAAAGAPGAFAFDGSLAWAPTPLTMVKVTASTALAPPDDASRALYRAGVSATWQVNQFHRVTAGYQHEWRDGADSSRPAQSDAMLLEFRMER